jgi:hypothetical protein
MLKGVDSGYQAVIDAQQLGRLFADPRVTLSLPCMQATYLCRHKPRSALGAVSQRGAASARCGAAMPSDAQARRLFRSTRRELTNTFLIAECKTECNNYSFCWKAGCAFNPAGAKEQAGTSVKDRKSQRGVVPSMYPVAELILRLGRGIASVLDERIDDLYTDDCLACV